MGKYNLCCIRPELSLPNDSYTTPIGTWTKPVGLFLSEPRLKMYPQSSSSESAGGRALQLVDGLILRDDDN
jgi:hypothetical protein